MSLDAKVALHKALENINQEIYELDVPQEDLETIHTLILDMYNLIESLYSESSS